MRLTESPTFRKMKESGQDSHAPYSESFGQWANLKLVLIAFFGVMCAQGAYWYTVFFYSEVFLEKFLKVDGAFANLMIMLAAIASAPMYVFFGWLSDKIGRKPVMWFGMVLGALTLFPGSTCLSEASNPALVAAAKATPIVVVADPAACSFEFDVTGKGKFLTSCDIARSTLANAGASYTTAPDRWARPPGSGSASTALPVPDGRGLKGPALKALSAGFDAKLSGALKAAGYPTKSDPAAAIRRWSSAC